MDADGFVERGDPLLFVKLTVDDAYLIQLQSADVFGFLEVNTGEFRAMGFPC